MPRSRLLQVVEIVQRQRARREARGHSFGHRALQICALVLTALSIAAALLALALVPFVAFVARDLPPVELLEQGLNPVSGTLLQPTQFYDRSGQQMLLGLEPPEARRAFIQATDSPLLAAAIVASSDPDFWQHSGFRWTSLNNRPNTLAERLAANLLLADEPDGWLKTLRTRLLAAFATQRYGREQILTWAINNASFGHWAFGAESAARLYFGKPASELSLAEAAMLAATAQAPALNPIDAPKLATEFQRLVLVAMKDQGLISEEEFGTALLEPLNISAAPSGPISLAPDFTDLALEQLSAQLGQERVQRGGLKVITTLDLGLQRDTEAQIAASNQNAEVVVLDASHGQIIAMLRAGQHANAPGNMLSAFVYLSAFARGYAPASLTWDVPSRLLAQVPETGNADGVFHGPITLRSALANNYLVPTMDLLAKIGPETVWREAQQAGLTSLPVSHGNDGLRLLWDEEKLPLTEVAQAYAVLGQQGLSTGQFATDDESLQPASLLQVQGTQGEILLDWGQPQTRSITSPELAFLVTNVLSDTSARVDSSLLSRPAAFLSGQSLNGEDFWAAGYSPQRVVIVLANEKEKAASLWAALFERSHQGLPIQSWQAPPGLSSVMVCVPSGQLPSEDCPETRREFYLSGNEPHTTDTLFQRLAVNRINGLLATVYTPQEFIEERVFIYAPSDAEAWARQAGLPIAPEDYDPIPSLASDAGLAILAPLPFSQASGVITIEARIPDEASAYDIQVGAGLRPNEWQLLSSSEQISAGEQTILWDSKGLNGIWVIQLQIWDEQGKLQRTYTLVSILSEIAN